MVQVVEKPETGTLLIAHPVISDPNFKRTVVLLCEHGEDGTYGLVLNRRTPLSLTDVLDDPTVEAPLYYGGPVQTNTLHIIHRLGTRIEGSRIVQRGVFWGGTVEAIVGNLSTVVETESAVRFYAGYSGWSEKQLEEEISQGGWILASADDELLFNTHSDDLWRVLMRKMGGEFAMMSTFPDHPELN